MVAEDKVVMQILWPYYKQGRCALAEQSFNIMAEIHTRIKSPMPQAKAYDLI